MVTMTVDGTRVRVGVLPDWMPMGGFACWPFGVFIKARLMVGDYDRAVLRHETQHIRDQKRWSVLFLLSYFILPIGPSFKAFWEWRAYKLTLLDEYERLGYVTLLTRRHVAEWLAGPLYGWAIPKSFATYLIDREAERLERRKA